MVVQEGIMEQPNIVGRWSEALKALHGRIAHRFARSEARERIRRYLLGQLGRERQAACRGDRRGGSAGRPKAAQLCEVGRDPGAR